MKRQFAQALLIVLFAFGISSCAIPLDRVFSRYGLAFTEPKEDEIVGVWTPDEATLKDMRERGKYFGECSAEVYVSS